MTARDLQGNTTRVERAFSTLSAMRRLPPLAGPGGRAGGPVRPPAAGCGERCPGSTLAAAAHPAAPRRQARPAAVHAVSRAAEPRSGEAAAKSASPPRRRAEPPAGPPARPSPRRASRSDRVPGALLADDFERRDAGDAGPPWSEREGKSVVRLEGGRLVFEAADEPYRPLLQAPLPPQTGGILIWEFELDFRRTGRERTYAFWMQLGAAKEMSSEDPTEGGVAVNLVWGGPDQGLETDEGLGYVEDGDVVQIATVSGPTLIRAEIDLDRQTYSLSAAGETATDVRFDSPVPIDTVRYFAHLLNRKNFEARHLDNVSLRRGEAAPAAAAPPPRPTADDDAIPVAD